ncbi:MULTISPECIES: hypothetical protein [unclassified Acinetobacter]|uniref:hypothetical protein n=1 Tax=unclassified Acinetobacter TaxID=196816 RepID=UPI0015D45926|nr:MULTISPECIES: hypothetical protein [unclassified Acinetobacter]QOW48675.1 hypothetical protein G0029_02040 [Acinetobacter sp. YH12138]UUS60426.1 hypothetical protein MST17_13900 [Acinetobacter sp. YH16056_T]
MSQKVVLLDLENNPPTANLLRNIIEHYSTLYVFSCSGKFEYALEDLTEIAGWIASGQLVVLDIPETPQKEFEYAVIVGQLMALMDPDAHIEVISAMPDIELLMEQLDGSGLSAHLIQIQSEQEVSHKVKYKIPDLETIRNKPDLLLIKHYCDGLEKLSGKPNSLDKLKNSLMNILQVSSEKAQHLVGMLINLKIVKRFDEQISIRKKVLKQWVQLDLNTTAETALPIKTDLNAFTASLEEQTSNTDDTASMIQAAQQGLFKNFNKIDPVQMEVIRKLHELKSDKPKDIYALRDLLEQMFPQSDVRLLLKELIEKGYIYWNGHEVLYSHEMFLN